MMRRIGFILLLGCLSVPCWSEQPQTVTLRGKPIQRDGFLLEWNEAQSRHMVDRPEIAWDAIRTANGLSGYFKYDRRGLCSQWNFQFFPDTSSPARQNAVYHPGPTEGPVSTQSVESQNGVETVIVEWVLPWDQISVDSGGNFAVKVAAISGCQDTLTPLVLQGKTLKDGPQRHRAMRPYLLIQLLVVVIILVLMMNMRSRLKRFHR
jgi:hypothetical protein